MKRLDPKQSIVLVVDVQDKIAGVMPEARLASIVRATRILAEGARLLGAQVWFSEQYPKGLGPTLPEIAELLDAVGARRFEKMEFSACDAEGIDAALDTSGASSVVVVGIETHVCVFQTVRDLCARGIDVHVPIDGVASRRDDHRDAGLELCRSAGAQITTTESIAFDWLRSSGTPEFKQLSKLIR